MKVWISDTIHFNPFQSSQLWNEYWLKSSGQIQYLKSNINSKVQTFNPSLSKSWKGNSCSLFLVLGVLGNLATCLVIIKNEYMRTTTNIYLFNLALADLGTLVLAMPAELYLMWRQYPWTFGEVSTSKYTKVLVICRTHNTSYSLGAVHKLRNHG